MLLLHFTASRCSTAPNQTCYAAFPLQDFRLSERWKTKTERRQNFVFVFNYSHYKNKKRMTADRFGIANVAPISKIICASKIERRDWLFSFQLSNFVFPSMFAENFCWHVMGFRKFSWSEFWHFTDGKGGRCSARA
jgi:hypothetical protein